MCLHARSLGVSNLLDYFLHGCRSSSIPLIANILHDVSRLYLTPLHELKKYHWQFLKSNFYTSLVYPGSIVDKILRLTRAKQLGRFCILRACNFSFINFVWFHLVNGRSVLGFKSNIVNKNSRSIPICTIKTVKRGALKANM